MMPIGPLMIEHRLIERAIEQMRMELGRARPQKEIDVHFIDSWVDFVRTYADQIHHGKEEKILFNDLGNKPLSTELKHMMEGLIEDHAKARELLSGLVSARDRYFDGEVKAFDDILKNGEGLVNLYPVHIRKEDREFFIPVMQYFTEGEKQGMLERFKAFDESVMHDHYRSVVESMERRSAGKETI
jgi:hemerythrin-like domain-containing protein